MRSYEIAFAIVASVFVAALVGAGLAANIAWAPHAADLRVEELRVQTVCIQQGGIYDGFGKCIWSKAGS